MCGKFELVLVPESAFMVGKTRKGKRGTDERKLAVGIYVGGIVRVSSALRVKRNRGGGFGSDAIGASPLSLNAY